jgi:hypothetical protein
VKLNESQKNLIQQRLHSVWKGERNCPICSNPTTWNIGGIVEVREFNEGNLCHGAAITPLAKATCSNCGYVVLFNAILLGVVDSDTAKVKELEP